METYIRGLSWVTPRLEDSAPDCQNLQSSYRGLHKVQVCSAVCPGGLSTVSLFEAASLKTAREGGRYRGGGDSPR